MATVGGVAVDILRGDTTPQNDRVEIWFVPGLDSIGAAVVGENQSEFNYRAVFYGTQASVESRISALEALQATIVTVTDDHSSIKPNCLIAKVGAPSRRKIFREGATQYWAIVPFQGVRTA